jgi:nucleoid DNA-binding protein
MTNDSTTNQDSSSVKQKQPKKPRISRKKLCEAISNFTDYHKYEVEDIIKALPVVMTDLLMSGARVKIDGLGTFYIKKGATRTFLSTIDGKEHTVKSKDTLALKPDNELRRKLNPEDSSLPDDTSEDDE